MEQWYIKARMRSLSDEETKNVKKRLKSIGNGYNGSAAEFRQTVLPYWKPFGRKPKKYWYDLFCNGQDRYDPRYIPDTVWYQDILPYFNYIAINKAYRDKGMYSRTLADVKKPETVVKNIAGCYFNGDGDRPISFEEAAEICRKEEHLIVKPSVNSGSGRSITFYDRDDPKSEKPEEIFRRFGEARLRALETRVISEISQSGGLVVATGGGAVLRRENVDALKRNGTLVFLDRPPADLLPTDDRPLADDAEKLKSLYAVREPIYRAAADVTVPVRGTPEDTANDILEMLQ